MASSGNSADIGIRVFLQDAASAGLYALDANLGRIGDVARKSGMLFGDLSLQLAGLAVVAGLAVSFVGFGAAMVYSVKQAQDLQQALTDISLATGLTTDQMEKLTPFLFNLGANSIYSLQQLADGIAVVGQYGFKTTQQIEDMASAGVKLAEATGSDTVSAFKLLAVTMQAFNIPASKADDVAALLFYSFEHGTPNIANLTSAMGQLGGVSTTLRISLQDILPALDTVTVGMGTATTAAAGLRYFLVNIVHPTSAASKELQKLGISAFDAQGNFVGLKPLLEDISNKVKGLSDQAKSDILGTLFNIRSGTAIKQLLQQIKEYEQGVKNANDVTKAKSDLDKAVEKVMAQLGPIIHQVTSNFQDFAALVGMTLGPVLTGFLQNVVNPLVTQLRQWAQDPSSAQVVSHFLLLGAAVSGVGLIIVGTVMSPIVLFITIMALVAGAVIGVALLIQNFGAIWARLQPIVNGVKIALASVGVALAIVGGIIGAIKLTDLVQGFMSLLPSIISVAQAIFTQYIPSMLTAIPLIVRIIANDIIYAATNLGTLIPSILSSAGAWLLSAAAEMLALAPYILLAAAIAGAVVGLVLLIQHLGGLNVILGLARAVWAAILPALQQAGAAIKGAFLEAVKQLQPVWQQLVQAFNQAKPFLMALGLLLGVILVTAIAVIIGVLRALINIFAAVITTVIHVVAGIIQAFAGVIQFFLGFFTVIHGILTGNFSLIQQGFSQMGKGILNIVQGLWSAVSSVFVGAFNVLKGLVTGLISGITGFFQGLANNLIHHSIIPDMLSAIVGAITGFVPHAISAFTGFVTGLVSKAKEIPNQVKNAIGDLGNLLYSAGQNLIQGFINGLKSMVGNVLNSVQGMLNSVRNMFPHSPAKEGPLTDAHLWMPNLINMLSDTADKAAPSLKSSMSRVAGNARSGLGTPGGSGGGSGGGGDTYTLTVDGKAFMSFFHNRLTGELQANGLGRVLR